MLRLCVTFGSQFAREIGLGRGGVAMTPQDQVHGATGDCAAMRNATAAREPPQAARAAVAARTTARRRSRVPRPFALAVECPCIAIVAQVDVDALVDHPR